MLVFLTILYLVLCHPVHQTPLSCENWGTLSLINKRRALGSGHEKVAYLGVWSDDRSSRTLRTLPDLSESGVTLGSEFGEGTSSSDVLRRRDGDDAFELWRGGAGSLVDLSPIYREHGIRHAPHEQGHLVVLKFARPNATADAKNGWDASAATKRRALEVEVDRLVRYASPWTVALLGTCLDEAVASVEKGFPLNPHASPSSPPVPRRYGLAVETLVPWTKVPFDPNLTLSLRISLALSAARMVRFWATLDPPRFLWDLKAVNVAVNLDRTTVKVVDVESLARYVPLPSRDAVDNTCDRDMQCVPHRLAHNHDKRLLSLSELKCRQGRCGTLGDATNVYRICLIVVRPVLAWAGIPDLPKSSAFREELASLLSACLEEEEENRLSSSELVDRMEELQARFSRRSAALTDEHRAYFQSHVLKTAALETEHPERGSTIKHAGVHVDAGWIV